MTKKEKISLGIAVGAAAAVWFLERRLNTKGTSGIGWAQAYASKKRILTYFDYPGLIDYVYIDLTERKGNYVDARIYFKSRMPAMFWISKEDARWLSELCDKHDVEFVAYNGNVSLPSLHKKIVMDFGTETERLPRI